MLFEIVFAAFVATLFVRLFGFSDGAGPGRPAGA